TGVPPVSTSMLSKNPKKVPSASVSGAGAPPQPAFPVSSPVAPVAPVEAVGPVGKPVVPVGDVGPVTLVSPVGSVAARASSPSLRANARTVPPATRTARTAATISHGRRVLPPPVGGWRGDCAGVGAVASGGGGGTGGWVGSFDT